MPDFPNVPNVPGVPAVNRSSANVPGAVLSLLVSDLIGSALNNLFGPQWGVFDKNGNAVIVADSVISVDYRRDWAISTFPIESGGFKAYDKVQQPFDVRLRFSAAGASTNTVLGAVAAFAANVSLFGGAQKVGRQALLDSVESVANSFDLFDAVTPDKIYTDISLEHIDYKRSAQNGLDLIVADVWAKEVRIISTQSFTQSPASADPSSTGTVQPQTPTAAESNGTGL